jgi:NAD-dependent deacetylase
MIDAEDLVEWLVISRSTCIFTGAGMSTESGLPDFRSAGGLWRNNRRFEELASTEALAHSYGEFVDFYRWRIEELAKYGPHDGHRVLARWEAEGRIRGVITQNVDGFHHRAGSRRVHELHGSLRLVRCQRCGQEAPAADFLRDPPTCSCGGKRRPGVVLFGEVLPADALDGAQELAKAADLFIVLGSSLLVSPANFFPQVAKAAGARLVIVNHDPTPLDDLADLVVRQPIGPTLAAVAAELDRMV